MSRTVRRPAFCVCESKDADQLRGNREADRRLCFRYIDSTIPILSKCEISSLLPSCVVVERGLCGTWSETPKTKFLTTRLIWYAHFRRNLTATNMSYRSISEPLLYGSLKLLPSLCNKIMIWVKHSFLIDSVRVNDGNEANISIHCSLGVRSMNIS